MNRKQSRDQECPLPGGDRTCNEGILIGVHHYVTPKLQKERIQTDETDV